jgi:hypothetical protein
VAQVDEILEVVRQVMPDVAVLRAGPAGLSGAKTALAEGSPGLFVKWASQGDQAAAEDLAREAENLLRVIDVPGVVRLVQFDPDLPLLILEQVHVDATAAWDDLVWTSAVRTLKAVRQVPGDGLGSVSEWKSFRDRGAVTFASLLESTSGDMPLSRYLLQCYDAVRTNLGTATTCHGDAHPDNWLLGATGPILADFGRMALGPVGFDEAFLLAHLDVPARTRLAWAERADLDLDVDRVVVGACAARLAVGRCGELAGWREWCEERWPAAVSLAAALA